MTFVPDILIGLRLVLLLRSTFLFVSVMHFARVYALYRRNTVLKYALPFYLVAQLAVALWIYLTPGMHRKSRAENILSGLIHIHLHLRNSRRFTRFTICYGATRDAWYWFYTHNDNLDLHFRQCVSRKRVRGWIICSRRRSKLCKPSMTLWHSV